MSEAVLSDLNALIPLMVIDDGVEENWSAWLIRPVVNVAPLLTVDKKFGPESLNCEVESKVK